MFIFVVIGYIHSTRYSLACEML